MSKKLKENYCSLWFAGSWNTCCYDHDEDFMNPNISFLEANNRLFRCVKDKGKRPLMAVVMWLGVSSPIGLGFWLYNRWLIRTERI